MARRKKQQGTEKQVSYTTISSAMDREIARRQGRLNEYTENLKKQKEKKNVEKPKPSSHRLKIS